MTVIAYRDGVLAADTAGWCGQIMISTAEQKLFRTPSGTLFACAGLVPDRERFAAWAFGGFDLSARPRQTRDFGAITITSDGRIIKYDAKFEPYPWVGTYAVEGCEEQFMLGAMAAGASAEEAVRLAIEQTAYAGGSVSTLRLSA